MKSQEQWFSEYAESHQHKINQNIHFICVPSIYFSIVGMLMSIPSGFIHETLRIESPVFGNWAALVLALLMIFYVQLSVKTFVLMLAFTLFSLYGNFYLSQIAPLLETSIFFFVLAWIGQFYGHKLEGKKPSFFKDLQFLLIGPAWVFEKITH